MNVADEPSKYLSEQFWQNQETDLLLSPYLSNDDKQILQERVRSFVRSHSVHGGYIGLATSGTTQISSSLPEKKLILTSKIAFRSAAQLMIHHYKLSSGVWVLQLPIYHVGGLSILARAALMNTRVISMGPWDPEKFIHQIKNQQDSLFVSFVPTQVYDLIQVRVSCPRQVQKVFIGGGQLSNEVFMQAKQLGWPLFQTYGMTETSAMIADFDEVRQCYRPFSGIEVTSDHEGRLRVKTPGIFRYQLTENRFETQNPEDFYRTDDLVEMTGDGGFVLLGRVQNQIKILGELVNVQALEQKVLKHLRLENIQATLAFVPDERAGNKLILCIDQTVQESLQLLREKLNLFNTTVVGYERIHDVISLKAFPRTDLGKIHRGRLIDYLNSLR